MAWPADESLWGVHLAPAREEFAALCRGIRAQGRGEALHVLVPDEPQQLLAARALAGLGAHFHRLPYGDIWVRDTGPLFLLDGRGRLAAARFGFDGWGGKYLFEDDLGVAEGIGTASGVQLQRVFDWVLEGGSIEVDGAGTCLTSRSCLLDGRRAPGVSATDVEARLAEALGAEHVVWLERGLLNDHTDGHVDTLARFSAVGNVLCMRATEMDDPNREVLEEVADTLASHRDARGQPLNVVRLPSPGAVLGSDGEPMPASYLNFYIANRSVVVPTYGRPNDGRALAVIARCFPGRQVIGARANALLEGGGAFHCITQPEPQGAAS